MKTQTQTTNKPLTAGALVQLGAIDMDGYWGRELHPEKTDAGKLAVILSVHKDASMGEVDDLEIYFTCQLLNDTRKLEIMEFEIAKEVKIPTKFYTVS